MNTDKLKKTIETTETVGKLWKIGEKLFGKNENAVCAVTYLIERAYILGKQDTVKNINNKRKSSTLKKS